MANEDFRFFDPGTARIEQPPRTDFGSGYSFSGLSGGQQAPGIGKPLSAGGDKNMPMGANEQAALSSGLIEAGSTAAFGVAEMISGRRDQEAMESMQEDSDANQRLIDAERQRQQQRSNELDMANAELRRIQQSFFDRQAAFEREFEEKMNAIAEGREAREGLKNTSVDNRVLRNLRMRQRRG